MPSRRRHPDSDRLRAVILDALGWSPTRIGRELGVVSSTVQRWLHPELERRVYEQNREARARLRGTCVDCGGETRWSGKGGQTLALRCPTCETLRRRTIDRDEVVRLRHQGLTTGEIAAHLGCSQPRVAKILLELGLGHGRGYRPGDTQKRRYIVRGTSGYPITGREATSGNKYRTSYSVLDSEYLYREVATFYVGDRRGGEAWRRRLANRECSRLNAIDQLARIAEEAA